MFPARSLWSRVRGNRFPFHGREYRLFPNRPAEELYLHGDASLGSWDMVMQNGTSAQLEYRRLQGTTPYSYSATETFTLREDGLALELSVRNDAAFELRFGLGLHPFFPMAAQMG